MASNYRVSICANFVIILGSIFFKTVTPCSPDPSKPSYDITELAILAPVVIVGHVTNISVDSNIQIFTQYSACLDVKEIIKRDNFVSVPKRFCTKQFGTEAMCLSHVYPNVSYLFFLDNNLQARYDAHFSAARLATYFAIAQARRGYCDVKNSTNCVPPSMADVPKQLVEADEGNSVVLTCRASGTKPHVVTWLFEGSSSIPLFSNVGYDGSLYIRKLSKSSGGKYTCTVKNAAGSISHDINIVVKLKHCGGNLMVNKRLNIASPNFPGEYPQDKTCVWRLCPRRGNRIKFNFNMFQLNPYDSINIDNECNTHGDSWRIYCGSVTPGSFVSRCKSKCVQLRLVSRIKYEHEEQPFVGMNFTVEPSRKRRTKMFDFLRYYCSSDSVIKGRYVFHNPPINNVRIFALESFKEPYSHNTTYDIVYKNEDKYGCYKEYDFRNDYYYFMTKGSGIFNVIAAIPDIKSQEADYLKAMLKRYKDKDPSCQPSK
ncbi:uncharacterized protein LOC114526372 [Dendronephthya gigantea]|uniref:uncharacterized protein LOC114526372 n=1 Tax=Dendronephthya gigantea TaxID=151771 RepID=UPI00106C8D2F|nr:uncharacterized protein LOC114526372 [Dendronephthya gigantea]XP_028403762.1 uncharacterized protein LOC114526372 [Dendronephthya gigantea]